MKIAKKMICEYIITKGIDHQKPAEVHYKLVCTGRLRNIIVRYSIDFTKEFNRELYYVFMIKRIDMGDGIVGVGRLTTG